MYSARISRNSPAAFIILIDQSGSMAETVVIDRKEVVKAKAVAFIVNMLIAELLNRSRREEGYRDYFDIAVLGYHGDEVASLWKNPNRMFMRPQRFDRKRTVSRARSTGAPVARRAVPSYRRFARRSGWSLMRAERRRCIMR